MSYGHTHTEDDCDKCGKRIGKDNLKKLPFLYMDKNDVSHPDVSWMLGPGTEPGYRQYYACEECIKKRNI